MASNLLAMASTLVAMASKLLEITRCRKDEHCPAIMQVGMDMGVQATEQSGVTTVVR